MKSGIYSITNIINKKIYIGSAVDIKKRWRDHRSYFKLQKHQNSYFQSSWNKYGKENFKFEVIEYCQIDILRERESYFIEYFDSKNRLLGYNINDPKSISSYPISRENKDNLSKRMLGDKNPMFGIKGDKHPKFGYKVSDDIKKILSDVRKSSLGEKSSNAKLTNEQVLEIRSKYIPRLYSTTKLAKEYGVTQGTIMNIINRKGWTHI